LYTAINDPEHNLFNWIASSTAVLLIVMTGLAMLAARRMAAAEQESEKTRKLWRALMLLSVAGDGFDDSRPKFVFWTHLPKLRFVAVSVEVDGDPRGGVRLFYCGHDGGAGRMRWIRAAIVILVTAATASVFVQQTWWDSEDIPVLREAIAHDQGFEGTDDDTIR